MYAKLPISLAAIFISLLAGLEAVAQERQIRITNEQRLPVPHATIYLNQKAIGKSDEQGTYTLQSDLKNPMNLLITAVGYAPFSVRVKPDTLTVLPVTLAMDDVRLKEVVVTAGRKVESIDEIPSSVSILTRREIEAQAMISQDLSAILGNSVPGLGTGTNKASNSGQTLRGRQVLVLIDGIPQSTPLMNGSRDIRTISPLAIERVEVIKGATSIYGNGSGGGIINYITKKPQGDRKISGQTNVGTSLNPLHTSETLSYRASQLLQGKLDKLSYVVSGSMDYTGLFRDGKGEANGQDDGLSNTYQYNAFIKTGYQFNDKTSLTAFYNFYKSIQKSDYINKAGVYGQTPSIGIKGDNPGDPAGTPFNHNVSLNFHRDELFGQTSLDLTAYYNHFISMNRYVPGGTAWYGPGQTQIQSTKKGIRLNLNTPWKLGPIPGEVTYGIDLLNDKTNQFLTDGRIYIPDMDMVNLAPYAQLKADLLPDLIFKGGVRYENASVTVKDFNTIATGPDGQGSIFVKGGKIPYNATMFNAGLRYTRFDLFNPFVSFSQGFAINELGRILRRATESTLDNLETDAIITNNYEVGFSSRYQWLSLSAAYYFSTSELGLNMVDVGGYLMPQREPEEVRGYELAVDARLSSKVSVGGSYAYVEGKAELDDGKKVYLNGIRIAPPKGTGYIYYKPVQRLDLRLFWVHTGSRDRFEVNSSGKYNNSEGAVRPVNLFNLAAGYTVNPSWRVSLGIENIFNTSYYPVVSQYRGIDAEYVRGNGMIANLNVSFQL